MAKPDLSGQGSSQSPEGTTGKALGINPAFLCLGLALSAHKAISRAELLQLNFSSVCKALLIPQDTPCSFTDFCPHSALPAEEVLLAELCSCAPSHPSGAAPASPVMDTCPWMFTGSSRALGEAAVRKPSCRVTAPAGRCSAQGKLLALCLKLGLGPGRALVSTGTQTPNTSPTKILWSTRTSYTPSKQD